MMYCGQDHCYSQQEYDFCIGKSDYHDLGDGGNESLPKNANVLQLFQYIIKNFGPKYLYKGLEAKLLQAIVTAGFMFLTYEKISSLIFALSGLEKSIK